MMFCCPTCPYVNDINRKYVTAVKLKKKVIDEDVFGGNK